MTVPELSQAPLLENSSTEPTHLPVNAEIGLTLHRATKLGRALQRTIIFKLLGHPP